MTERMTVEEAHDKIPHVCDLPYCGCRDLLEAVAAGGAEKERERWMALVRDSEGVAGYHLNGNVASWSEFPHLTGEGDGEAK